MIATLNNLMYQKLLVHCINWLFNSVLAVEISEMEPCLISQTSNFHKITNLWPDTTQHSEIFINKHFDKFHQLGTSYNFNKNTRDVTFIWSHPAVFTVTEIRRNCTIGHNTLTPHSTSLHVSVHQNRHQVHLLQMFKKCKSICDTQFLR